MLQLFRSHPTRSENAANEVKLQIKSISKTNPAVVQLKVDLWMFLLWHVNLFLESNDVISRISSRKFGQIVVKTIVKELGTNTGNF